MKLCIFREFCGTSRHLYIKYDIIYIEEREKESKNDFRFQFFNGF